MRAHTIQASANITTATPSPRPSRPIMVSMVPEFLRVVALAACSAQQWPSIVAGADLIGQQTDQQMQDQRQQDEIIDDAEERDRKVEGLERVQDQHYGRRPQPHGPVSMPQREPEQPQVASGHAPESKQPQHV